ncbi:MAG: serine/threonine-protein kinase [Acidobacteriota bacterium]
MNDHPISSFDDLLRAAVAAPAGEVEEVLAACPDPALRGRVRALLAAEGDLAGFLETPALGKVPIASAPALDRSLQHRSLLEATSTNTTLGHSGRRLRTVGWGGLVFSLFLLVYLSVPGFLGLPWRELRTELLAAGAIGLLSGLPLSSRDPHRLARRGLIYMVAICGFLAVFHAAHELRVFGIVTPFGPFLLVAGIWPLIQFFNLRTALVSTGLACLAATAGLGFVIVPAGELPRVLPLLPNFIAAAVTGAGTAVAASFGILRLRRQVEKAKQLGSYRLHEKLGAGGMGEVWRATHHLLARPTAIKLIRPRHLESSTDHRRHLLERFAREARATASLRSPHTVALYDFGITGDGTCFIAMELIDGLDLSRLVERFGRQPPARVRHILSQACDSLGEAHLRGLVHRDIKPGNLMVCRQGRQADVVKVLDFGIVALTARQPMDPTLTVAGDVLGTPAAMAPETLRHAGSDERSDLYALGCVGYWLLTGRQVFEVDTVAEVMAAHLRDEPRPPSAVGVDVPADIEAVIMRCLAKQPGDRWPSADALAEALAGCSEVPTWSGDEAAAWWRRHIPAAPPRSPASGALRQADITSP